MKNFCNVNFALLSTLHFLLKLPFLTAYGVSPFVKHFQEHCDWRGQSEICDQSRGLACSYLTESCDCWDARKIFSTKVHRCVGKAGDECAYFETERQCTENSYCLEDRSLSPIPLCVCLKGYFRTDNGSCVKYSKFGEACESFPPNRLACEPNTGLKCYAPGYASGTCQCEPDHIYDKNRDLCIALVGAKCSKTLNNCVENADCSEKTWALDHITRTTKLSGYRCVCKGGLKETEDGHCFAEYGGVCKRTLDCFPGENLTCLNSICQCQPLSQIYVKKHRKCFNLAGTKCQPQNGKGGVDKNGNSSLKNASSRTNSKISLESSTTKESSSQSSSTTESSSVLVVDVDEDEKVQEIPLEGTQEGVECILNSECVTTAQGSSHCQCVAGTSETMMKTCLLNYGQSCQKHANASPENSENEILQSRAQILVLEKEMKCNVFEGLICQSDSGKCTCADPSLVYDSNQRDGGGPGCVARVGKACGNLRLGMLDLSQEIKDMIFINCEKNSTCLELSGGGGMSKRVCVPFNRRMAEVGGTGAGSSLSKIMFNNANVISATD